MKFLAGPVAGLVRLATRALLRLEAVELAAIPERGPLIIAMNHVNFLDAPILISRLYPREVVSLAKKETWDNVFVGALASLFGAIPLDREISDLGALRRALAVLEGGGILLVAPEGTRGRSGVLRTGRQGIASLALRSGAPILPVGFIGLERFGPSIKKFRRAEVRVRIGEAFRLLKPALEGAKTARLRAIEEIMLRIAELLPEEMRGPYALDGAPAYRYSIPVEA